MKLPVQYELILQAQKNQAKCIILHIKGYVFNNFEFQQKNQTSSGLDGV